MDRSLIPQDCLILVPIDLSPQTDVVLDTAANLAERLGAELCIVHLAAPDPDFVGMAAGPQSVRDIRAERLRVEHRLIQEKAKRLRASGIVANSLLIQGPTIKGIVEQAQKLEAGLIVMGCHSKGPVSRVILGSVSEGVLRSAPCPVLMVPDRE